MLVSFKFYFFLGFLGLVLFRGVCYGLFYALLQDGQLKGVCV